MKTALIFGVTGQDGSYLSELLLSKGYHVIGVSRRVSVPNDERIRHLVKNENFKLVFGDVTDAMCVQRCVMEAFGVCVDNGEHPLEVYNLAAQSHVYISFGEPHHTTQATYLGALNILECLRPLKDMVRFYQASSSEMFGSACSAYDAQEMFGPTETGRVEFTNQQKWNKVWYDEPFQDEHTMMLPCSPYAIAKLAAHHLCRLYRESYGVFACSGILFNHESERRGEQFVTRKVTKYIARYAYARRHGRPPEPLVLGNLDARRDWGHAEDYVKAMWLMLQQASPDDFVVATGETHTVREFVEAAFKVVGVTNLPIETDPSLFRPSEVPFLRGNPAKAKKVLGWAPEINFEALVKRMVLADMSGMYGDQLAEEEFEEPKVSER